MRPMFFAEVGTNSPRARANVDRSQTYDAVILGSARRVGWPPPS
jgi:hypothetical protein